MGKARKSQTLALAGPLLMAAVAMCSCIIPQPDDPGPAAPIFQDRPPRIIPNQIVPPISQQNTSSVGVSGCANPAPPDFHVYVEDDDLKDTIYSAWKATSLNGSSMASSGWLSGTTAMQMDSTRRSTQIDPPLTFFTSQPFMTTGLVRVDVTVSDGSFLLTDPLNLSENPVNTYSLPDGGFFQEPAGTDSFTWIVNVVNCPP
jgi:hypothetical protein